MVKVWFQHEQNVPSKINIDPDSDIDDLKEKIFGSTDKGQYQTTYNGQLLRPSAEVPRDTTDEMPIVFTKLVNVPSSKQEFAEPGSCKELDCKGRSCAKCEKCRDWHFSGDQDQWNWVCSWENWEDKDKNRWKDGEGLKLFTKRDGATCVVSATVPATVKTAHNRAVAPSDLVYSMKRSDDRLPLLTASGDRHFNTSADRHFNTTGDRHFNSAHLCLCDKH
ncbi:unnamed protein product [Adineta steineri]|uniref:Uncharacterized protein n=2 Tax=Adineta steineri TaxID=433720 RepID=A0A814YNA7_9BILA|nr:unnamed protein product [Adineta steineri]